MKGKRFLLVMVSLLLVVGLIWSVAGCAAPAAPGQATATTTVTKTVTATPEKAKREWTVDELGPNDLTYFEPLAGKKVMYCSMWLGWVGVQSEMDGFNKAIEELGGEIELSTFDCELSLEKQIQAADLAVTQGMDAWIATPVDLVGAGQALKILHAGGIPAINLGGHTAYRADFTVSPSLYQQGALSIEYICKQLNYEGNIAMINADRTSSSSVARNTAMYDVVAKYPGIKVVADETTGSYAGEPTYDVTIAVVKAHPEVQAIYYAADTIAMGGIPALKELDRMDIITVGGDGTKDGLKMIKAGDMSATTFYDLTEMGRLCMEAAAGFITSRPPYVAGTTAGIKWLPITVVTEDNIDQIPWPKYPLE